MPSDITLPFQQSLTLAGNHYEYRIINQDTAPLNIVFAVTPQMVTDLKYIMPSGSSTNGYYKEVTFPSPDAKVLITVVNSNTGAVLAIKGYGGDYAQETNSLSLPVLTNGPYTVQIEGNACTVDLSMKGSGTSTVYTSTAIPTAQKTVTPVSGSSVASTGNATTVLPVIIIIVAIVVIAGGGYGIYRMKQKPRGNQTVTTEKPLPPPPPALDTMPEPEVPAMETPVTMPDTVTVYPPVPDHREQEITVPVPEPVISRTRPQLVISLNRRQMAIGEWHRIGIRIWNAGDAPAVDVVLSFSEDIEVRGVKPVTVKAGETTAYDIGIFPKTTGTIPLEITAVFRDPDAKEYKSTQDLWIDVMDRMNITPVTDAAATPVQTPGSSLIPRSGTLKQLPPEFSDRYTESEFIGKGGFAWVFKAKRKDGKYVAVKIPISVDAATGKSFITEMQNWTKLEHPNIVRVFDYNIMPMAYFEMELCDGSLAELKKPVKLNEAVWILFNVCEGLKYTHKRSIVHRDLKPQNILLKNGIPKISDWGLSKVISDRSSTTATSFTPYYAAPEQVNNRPKDERTDIWQLGVILYEIVTGELPFKGESIVDIAVNISTNPPKNPHDLNPDATQIEMIILKCLEKDPAKRYQTILELQKALGHYLRKDYSEQLSMSVSIHDVNKSAVYCGDLVMINLLTGDIAAAYSYVTNLAAYAEDDVKADAMELSEQLRNRLDYGIIEIPDELIKKAEYIVYKISHHYHR